MFQLLQEHCTAVAGLGKVLLVPFIVHYLPKHAVDILVPHSIYYLPQPIVYILYIKTF